MGGALKSPTIGREMFGGEDRPLYGIPNYVSDKKHLLSLVQTPGDVCAHLQELLAVLLGANAKAYGDYTPADLEGQGFLSCRAGVKAVRESLTINTVFRARDTGVDGRGTRDLMKAFLQHPDTERRLAARLGVDVAEVTRVVKLALVNIVRLEEHDEAIKRCY